uniref:Uncharacterized protein n=1 Tax=Arion vulgaris TaxID=1028688 RepID=A0A0B6ZMH8_9EUPU
MPRLDITLTKSGCVASTSLGQTVITGRKREQAEMTESTVTATERREFNPGSLSIRKDFKSNANT